MTAANRGAADLACRSPVQLVLLEFEWRWTMLREMVDLLDYSLGYIRQSVADLSDEELVAQPAGVPNHAMWTLGHVTFSCQGIAGELGVEPWLPADWEATFGYGSTPSADLARYPTKAEMRGPQ